METLSRLGGGLFDWVLQSTWQASVLVGFILLAQFLLRKRLSPAWRCGLWLLLLVRLALPVPPESTFSIFNLASFSTRTEPVLENALTDMMVDDEVVDRFKARAATSTGGETSPASPQTVPGPDTSAAWPQPKLGWKTAVVAIWTLGVLGFTVRLAGSHLRFRNQLMLEARGVDSKFLEIFESCRAVMNVRQPVQVVETTLCDAPAVFGLLRKRLLLPTGIRDRFSDTELRHIFLHELAHLKRRDLEINWIFAALLCLHWFNPLLWFAFARMRSDREMATDALALSAADEADATPYGETILKALEGLIDKRANAGLVGIVENCNRIEQRIRAIATHKARRHWRSLAIVTTAVIACLTLTDAATEQPINKEIIPTPPEALEAPGEINDRSSTPAITPQSITISGTVDDANSGEPIPEFNVSLLRGGKVVSIEGDSFVGTGPRYVSMKAAGRDGQFVIETDIAGEDEGFQVRISSINHFEETSRIISLQYLEELNMKLRPGTGARGRVLLPGGRPAVRLPVFMSGIEDSVEMDQPGIPDPDDQDCPVVFTDDNGRFRFQPTDEEFSVVAFNDLGYAEISRHDPDIPYEIRLQPYGSIEGTLIVGGKPASGEFVRLQNFEHFLENDARGGRETISFSESAITDINGRFRFNKIPPGWCSVTRYRADDRGHHFLSTEFRVECFSGQTSTVTIGETGRSVHGSVIVSDYEGEVDWRDARATLSNMRSFTKIPLRSEQSQFWTSKEGRETFRRIKRYPMIFDADGSFRVNDIPPGTYDLNLTVPLGNWRDRRVPMIGDLPFVGRLFRREGAGANEPLKDGRLHMEIVIPESDNGDAYAPFDLGVLRAEYVETGNEIESSNTTQPNNIGTAQATADESAEEADAGDSTITSQSADRADEERLKAIESRYERMKSERKIAVAGSVIMPRPLELDEENPLTIMDAIRETRGFSRTANREKIRVLRGSEPERVFTASRLEEELADGDSFILKAGDIIIVEELLIPAEEDIPPTAETAEEKAGIAEGFVSISGAVITPQRIRLSSAGRISILDAITEAGGFSQKANRNKIRLLRRGEPEQILSERDLIRSFSEGTDPDLKPGDIVLVEESFL